MTASIPVHHSSPKHTSVRPSPSTAAIPTSPATSDAATIWRVRNGGSKDPRRIYVPARRVPPRSMSMQHVPLLSIHRHPSPSSLQSPSYVVVRQHKTLLFYSVFGHGRYGLDLSGHPLAVSVGTGIQHCQQSKGIPVFLSIGGGQPVGRVPRGGGRSGVHRPLATRWWTASTSTSTRERQTTTTSSPGASTATIDTAGGGCG
ncbi:hypothetical protein U9M48_000395 [Paspalum notatum var. saurae]|uniref:Uncharacterized protein n=1 Tax=Paspalum notatum var. saurae TaxID=547442 RepID=A0AAQ3SCC8_PASNO